MRAPGGHLIQPAHPAEVLRAVTLKVSKFQAYMPAHPPVSAFPENFVNLNVLRGTRATFAHVENERLVLVI